MSKTILVVDDEEKVLQAMEKILLSSGHRPLLASSGEAGLALLAEEQVDVVISDMQMPGMNGHQFLKQVRSVSPRTMRAILSGFTEGKDVINCLRDGSARMYILKPWDNDKL